MGWHFGIGLLIPLIWIGRHYFYKRSGGYGMNYMVYVPVSTRTVSSPSSSSTNASGAAGKFKSNHKFSWPIKSKSKRKRGENGSRFQSSSSLMIDLRRSLMLSIA